MTQSIATTAPDVFLSYNRADGADFTTAFQSRLTGAGLTVWRDHDHMQGGDSILPQVLDAIEEAEHLVLILTRGAIASKWVKREVAHARRHGTRISPVLADVSLSKRDLPPWLARIDIYDPADPRHWKRLTDTLSKDANVRRVPYATVQLPDGYVPRPAEFDALKEAILDPAQTGPVALTAALQGAGGYGKTTLADALCDDTDILAEFTDGILRVEIGKERHDLLPVIVDLIETLAPNGRRPGYQDATSAAQHLSELIGEARLLLVIDDAWRERQLRPFLLGGPNCVRLITTRMRGILPRDTARINVDEMSPEQALSLLRWRLPEDALDAGMDARLVELARRLGHWAQMLEIANGWLVERVDQDETLPDALDQFEARLSRRGLTGFDPRNAIDRHRAIHICVDASLEDLGDDDLRRFEELGILPEDEDVPFAVVAALWEATAAFDEVDTDELVAHLARLSLLRRLDRGQNTLRLHDNMIWILRDRLEETRRQDTHAAMAKALRKSAGPDFSGWPAEPAYPWQYLTWHLEQAGQKDRATALLIEPNWLPAAIAARGAQETFAQFVPLPEDPAAQLLGRVLALSLPALSSHPAELAFQITARFAQADVPPALSPLLARLKRLPSVMRPIWTSLTGAGAELMRLRGHHRSVNSAAFSPDGRRIVTASDDKTARIWDAATGEEIRSLRGHRLMVMGAAFSHDGSRIVTASDDGTARLWHAATGEEICSLRGHEGGVKSAAFSPDDSCVVTASFDKTARLWDAETGEEICSLRGHEASVNSAAFSPDGSRILTASEDRTARLWDATTGAEIRSLCKHAGWLLSAAFSPDGNHIVIASTDWTASLLDAATGAKIRNLRGHGGAVRSTVFFSDGTRIVTTSDDRTARLWDSATGTEIRRLQGHQHSVASAALSPDGSRIVTASDDGTARLWLVATGDEIHAMPMHDSVLDSAAFSPNGCYLVTASRLGAARLWDAATGAEIRSLRGHEGGVNGATFSPDGSRVVTASRDRTARLWDAEKGTEMRCLSGHECSVNSAAFSPNGSRVVTASNDETARLWDAKTSEEICILRGHEHSVNSAAFSPDGSRIITASRDRTACLWDSATGTEIRRLRGHKRSVESAAFSSDGTLIVTASEDSTARLWDAATGEEIFMLHGHEGGVNGAAFSPDGSRVVTASYDKTVRLWDAKTGEEISRVTLDAAILALAVHSAQVALGDLLGRLHLLSLYAPDRSETQ